MTGIKRSSKQILPMVIGSTLVLGLIWLNTFIHQNSFSDSYGDFSFLIEIIPAISLATLLNTLVMFRPAVWQSTYSTADCAQDAAWGAIAMMALLFCEIGGQGNVSFFSYSSVVLGSFTFPKRYIYDFWVIIWFPIQVDAILRAMKHEDFSRDAQQNGFTSLFVMTLEELPFFQAMPNIWQFDLLLLNTFTLAVAVWKYVPTEYAEKSILHVGLYAIIRTLCLPLQLKLPVEGDTICMLSSNWETLKVAVREIATHAAFFGTSDFLKVSADAHYWLADNRTPVLQLLYYGGWAAVIGLTLVLVGFIWVLVKLVDFRNARVHKEWSVYATAAGMLSYRAVCGMLYGFGAPWPALCLFSAGTACWICRSLPSYCGVHGRTSRFPDTSIWKIRSFQLKHFLTQAISCIVRSTIQMAPPALRTICLTNRFLFQAKKVSFRVLPMNTLCRKSHSQSLQRQLIPARSGSSWNTNPMNGCSRIRPQTNFSNRSDSGTVRIMPLFRWKAYIQMNTWRNHTMKILKLFKKYFCLTAVSIALLGLVLAGWKFSLQAARQAQKVNSINAWI